MKKRFLNIIKKNIKEQYPNYSKEKIDEIMYGVEGIYLTITKTIIIFTFALILGIFKELLFLLIAFNFIRLFAFGMHVDKSSKCLIFSSTLFIISTFICKYISINNLTLFILYGIIFISVILYAPADTVKRPILKKNKRQKFKILSIIVATIYFIISIKVKNNLLTNSLTIGLLIECILINPLTYKIFNMPYKNYKKYGLTT